MGGDRQKVSDGLRLCDVFIVIKFQLSVFYSIKLANISDFNGSFN